MDDVKCKVCGCRGDCDDWDDDSGWYGSCVMTDSGVCDFCAVAAAQSRQRPIRGRFPRLPVTSESGEA